MIDGAQLFRRNGALLRHVEDNPYRATLAERDYGKAPDVCTGDAGRIEIEQRGDWHIECNARNASMQRRWESVQMLRWNRLRSMK